MKNGTKVIYRYGQDPDVAVLLDALDGSGKTDSEIADKSGVCWSTIHNWRTGYVHNPQHITMAAVARALGLSWKLVRANR